MLGPELTYEEKMKVPPPPPPPPPPPSESLLCIFSCYSIPAGTSPEMKDLLMKLLKRNAKDRIDFGKITYIACSLILSC